MELARRDKLAVWNPALFHTKDGRLWLYYKYGTHPSTWLGARKFSTDEGLTWSPEEHLPDGILGPIKDKPLILPDGTIVSGSSVENGKWNAWVERSTDNGATWTKFGPITLSEAADIPDAGAIAASKQVDTATPDETVHTKLYPPAKEVIGIIQPSVVWLSASTISASTPASTPKPTASPSPTPSTTAAPGRKPTSSRSPTPTPASTPCACMTAESSSSSTTATTPAPRSTSPQATMASTSKSSKPSKTPPANTPTQPSSRPPIATCS